MSPQVFYRKWRPQTLSEVAGQEHVTQTLLQSLATGHVSHAYLFSGPRGTGKTSTGRILAKAVNCLSNGHGEPCNQCPVCQSVTQGSSMDVVEIDAASNRGIDDIRNLREKVAFVPGSARYKVYIVDEVHMLSEPAANALLKTLEEPPPHIIFILATTDPQKMPATILSRCQHFQFRRITQAAVAARLAFICDKEGITASPEALRLVANNSTGSLRDAENILEQMVAYYGSQLDLAQVKELLGLSGDARSRQLARNILEKNLPAGLATVNQVNSDGLDLRQFLKTLVDYLRQLLLLKAGAAEAIEVTPDELSEMKSLAGTATMDGILQAVKLFSQIDMRMDNYSTLPLELALVECVVPRENVSPRPEIRETTRTQPVAPSRPSSDVSRPYPATKSSPRPELVEGPPLAEPPPVSTPRAIKPEPAVAANSPSPSLKAEPQNRPENPVPAQAGIVTSGAALAASRPADAPPLDYLRGHWREFINSLKGEGSTGTLDTLLRSACEPVTIEGDNVVLGFYWPFHKEKIEDPKYCFLIERKLNQFLSGTYKLRCVLTEKKQRPATSSPSREQAGHAPATTQPTTHSPGPSRQVGTSIPTSRDTKPAPGPGQTQAPRQGGTQTTDTKKSSGHLIEAALKEGGHIINTEEK